jgi:hypothetical protein
MPVPRFAARALARPVHRHIEGRLRGFVIGVGADASYVQTQGLVIALTAGGVPLMPNGVALPEGARPAGLRHGEAVQIRPGSIEAGPFIVTWPTVHPPLWDPRIGPSGWSSSALRALGEAIAAALGVPSVADPEPLAGPVVAITDDSYLKVETVSLLFRAIQGRDPGLARLAATRLVGYGSGLTPEGDDLVAATAATVAALGASVGMPAQIRREFLSALVVPDLDNRTTALSATLLRLAIEGRVIEPVKDLLSPQTWGSLRWERGLAALRRIGHTTGALYAAGIAAGAILLTREPMAPGRSPKRLAHHAGNRPLSRAGCAPGFSSRSATLATSPGTNSLAERRLASDTECLSRHPIRNRRSLARWPR